MVCVVSASNTIVSVVNYQPVIFRKKPSALMIAVLRIICEPGSADYSIRIVNLITGAMGSRLSSSPLLRAGNSAKLTSSA